LLLLAVHLLASHWLVSEGTPEQAVQLIESLVPTGLPSPALSSSPYCVLALLGEELGIMWLPRSWFCAICRAGIRFASLALANFLSRHGSIPSRNF